MVMLENGAAHVIVRGGARVEVAAAGATRVVAAAHVQTWAEAIVPDATAVRVVGGAATPAAVPLPVSVAIVPASAVRVVVSGASGGLSAAVPTATPARASAPSLPRGPRGCPWLSLPLRPSPSGPSSARWPGRRWCRPPSPRRRARSCRSPDRSRCPPSRRSATGGRGRRARRCRVRRRARRRRRDGRGGTGVGADPIGAGRGTGRTRGTSGPRAPFAPARGSWHLVRAPVVRGPRRPHGAQLGRGGPAPPAPGLGR